MKKDEIIKFCGTCKHHPNRKGDPDICEKCIREMYENQNLYTMWEDTVVVQE